MNSWDKRKGLQDTLEGTPLPRCRTLNDSPCNICVPLYNQIKSLCHISPNQGGVQGVSIAGMWDIRIQPGDRDTDSWDLPRHKQTKLK